MENRILPFVIALLAILLICSFASWYNQSIELRQLKAKEIPSAYHTPYYSFAKDSNHSSSSLIFEGITASSFVSEDLYSCFYWNFNDNESHAMVEISYNTNKSSGELRVTNITCVYECQGQYDPEDINNFECWDNQECTKEYELK